MGAAEVTFDFDLELKKRSSLATILDQNSYTFNWMPKQRKLVSISELLSMKNENRETQCCRPPVNF